MKSEIIDPKNRNKVNCNLPPDEMVALKELIRLQKERKIMIKQCDKGAGVLIMEFDDYMNAAKEHLEETMEVKDRINKPYYERVNEGDLVKAKQKITELLQSGYFNEIISKQELEAMCPDIKDGLKVLLQGPPFQC